MHVIVNNNFKIQGKWKCMRLNTFFFVSLFSLLQKSFEIFTLSLTGKGICVSKVIITSIATTANPPINLLVTPMFKFFFMMFQKHQRGK